MCALDVVRGMFQNSVSEIFVGVLRESTKTNVYFLVNLLSVTTSYIIINGMHISKVVNENLNIYILICYALLFSLKNP